METATYPRSSAGAILRYERQDNVPNGQGIPVEYDFEPDPDRFSGPAVPAGRRGFTPDRRAYVAGAALFAGALRPVYLVGTLGLVLHLDHHEALDTFEHVYETTVREGRVVFSSDEWHARCRLGIAWSVRAVRETPHIPATAHEPSRAGVAVGA